MQHQILTPGPLHDEHGRLIETGYATSLIKTYDKSRIAANRLRIKEWDYYCTCTDRFALALTIADNGYMTMDSISLLEFDENRQVTTSRMSVPALSKRVLPPSSAKGDVRAAGKDYELLFENDGTVRRLTGHMDGFDHGTPIQFDLTLTDAPAESMVIVTPFRDKPKAFYYNQKINCMRTEGFIRCGAREFADIIQDFLDFQDYYTDELNLDVDHWKVSKKLLKMILRHPSVVKAYCANKNYFNPDEVKVDRDELLKWMHDSMDIWAFDVVDYKSRHEEDGKPVLDDPAFDEHNLVAASRKYRMFEMKCMEPITKPRQGMGGLTAADLYHFVEGRISVLNSWTERPIQNVVDCELFAGPVFNNVNNVGIATVWEE